MHIRPLSIVVAISLLASAQSEEKKQPTGAISGHVYCADTNAPARVARVQLESVQDEVQRAAGHPHGPQRFGLSAGGVVQTDFDGSFILTGVPPGSYYVIVTAPGYLSPRADAENFDDAQPQSPAGKPPLVIPKVDVEADQAANIDVRLERGASVSGTIRFDDGSPAPAVDIVLLHKSKDKWISSSFSNFTARASRETDDMGHYRISGLRDREYLLEAILSRTDTQPGGPHAFALRGINRSSLMIYSGDTMRQKDTVPFKLGPGEERTGEDITIPLSKLHTVGGVVTAALDGHAINGGFVHISTPEDRQTVAEAELDNTGTFHIECVPEGTYLLQVLNPTDQIPQDVPLGIEGMAFLNEKTLHQYGELEQTIKVEGDIPNLVLVVPEPKQQPAKNASQ